LSDKGFAFGKTLAAVSFACPELVLPAPIATHGCRPLDRLRGKLWAAFSRRFAQLGRAALGGQPGAAVPHLNINPWDQLN
jgi:hypothetical protein